MKNLFNKHHISKTLLLFLVLTGGAVQGSLAIELPAAKVRMPNEVRELVPIGSTTGIKLKSDGIMVVGVTDITVKSNEPNISPARSAGIKKGDVIAEINAKRVESGADLQNAVAKSGGKSISITLRRGDSPVKVSVVPIKSTDGIYKIGVLVRDSLMGIGTITFYEPKSGMFGALGHGISDPDSDKLVPIANGELIPSTVNNVTKGIEGKPGELHGEFLFDTNSGSVVLNSGAGIYGRLNSEALIANKKSIPIAKSSEVKVGKAQIISNVNGSDCKYYDINIVKIISQSENRKDMLIEVTDPELLNLTGGIVQGMSGSPVIQNGKLIGAVTHVLVSDPTRGYSIFIENMLNSLYTLDGKDAFCICA